MFNFSMRDKKKRPKNTMKKQKVKQNRPKTKTKQDKTKQKTKQSNNGQSKDARLKPAHMISNSILLILMQHLFLVQKHVPI